MRDAGRVLSWLQVAPATVLGMALRACAPDEPARVLLVEDDPRLAAFLDRALTHAGYRVDQDNRAV